MHLGPTFLQDHHPYLPTCCWFGKERFSLLVDWDVVIYNHLLEHSVVKDAGHVDAVAIERQRGKNVLYSVVVLGQGRYGTEEVAISQTSLIDVVRLDAALDEERVSDYVWYSFPGCSYFQLLDISNRRLVWWEIFVCEVGSLFLMFLNQI